MERVDLAIIGAGFAGLACARAAALRGLDVVVIDRKPYVGAHIHTTGLLVKEVVERWPIPASITRKIPRVRLYSPSLRPLDLESPDYHFLATDTCALLQWMAARARSAGARIRVRTDLERLQPTPDGVRLWGPDLSARFLVGADGASSRVARATGLGRNSKFLVGLELHLAGAPLPPDRLHCFIDRQLAPGYLAWGVPNGDVTQLGLAFRPRRGRQIDRLDLLAERVRSVLDVRDARIVEQRRGLIPVGGPVKRLGNEHTLLVGDAAGLVSPLTAGGIHTALQWGEVAGELIGDWLRGNGAHPVRTFEKRMPRFRAKRILRWLYDLPIGNAAADIVMRFGLARRMAQLIYFHNRGLLTLDGWRAVLRPSTSSG